MGGRVTAGIRNRALASGLSRSVTGLAARIARDAAADQNRLALWIPVLFGAGIVFYFSLHAEPGPWVGPAAALAATLGFVLAGRSAVFRYMTMGMLIAALGFAAAQWRTAQTAAPIIERKTPPVSVEGRVLSVELRADGSRRVLIAPNAIRGRMDSALPERVRVTMRGAEPVLAPGDRIRVRAVLMPPPAPATPGAFDYARAAWFERLGGVGYGLGAPERLAPDRDPSISTRIATLRASLSQRIREALPGPAGAFATAVMTGDRSGIAEEDWAAMRSSGLAHLLAISGLHMTAIAALIFFVVRAGLALAEPVALTRPVKKWAAAAAIVGGFAYLVLSGASISTQRAFVMILIAMIAVIADRPVLSLRTVAVAALAVMVMAPESVTQAGFQMSFAAVTALIAVFETWQRLRPPWLTRHYSILGRIVSWLAGIAVTTLIAGLATGLFAAFHFNRFGNFGLIANLLAVPVFTGLVMPPALAGFILMPLGLEAWPLWLMGRGIEGVLAIAHWVADWPGAVSHIRAMPPAALGLAVLGGLWLCIWTKGWRFAGLGAVALAFVLMLTARPPDILIDRDADLVAVRDGAGRLTVPFANRARFAGDVWLRRDGQEGRLREYAARADDRPGPDLAPGLWRCDAHGCAVRLADGRLLGFVRTAQGVAEDCALVDILVSAEPVRGPCPRPAVVIDRFDVWRNGAYAIWLNGTEIRVRSARQARGERPWVLPRLDQDRR